MEKPQPPKPIPKYYQDTYRQYKHAHSVILRWVQTTAASIKLSMKTHIQGKGRGKAKNAKAKAGAPLNPEYTTPKIPFKVFLKFVSEIAASNVPIPASLLSLLEASIEHRKRTAAFYSTDADVTESNKSHMFAIRAYTQALEILKAANRSSEPDSAAGTTTPLSLTNLGSEADFVLIEAMSQLAKVVEEDAVGDATLGSKDNEWIRDIPGVNGKSQGGKPKTFDLELYELLEDEPSTEVASAKLVPDNNEPLQALMSFIVDLDRMRRYCRNIWESVAPVGPHHLLTAAFVTNRAAQLAKQMEYTLQAEYPSLKDVTKSFEELHRFVEAGTKGGNQAIRVLVQERTMYHTCARLRQFVVMRRGGKDEDIPILPETRPWVFNADADRSKMNASQRVAEDTYLMNAHWFDLMVAYKITTPEWAGASPGLGKDFHAFINEGLNLSWALVFCFQMQLDTVQARRRYLEKDVEAMRKHVKVVLDDSDDYIASEVLSNPKARADDLPAIEHFRHAYAAWTDTDPTLAYKLLHGYQTSAPQFCQQMDSIFIYSPWLNANAMLDCAIEHLGSGSLVATHSGCVASALQMWNMLRQTGYIPASSPGSPKLLFDHLMTVLGPKVFFREPPKSGTEFIKTFELSTGVRLESFASGKRQFKKTAQQPYRRANPRHERNGRGILARESEAWLIYDRDYFVASDEAAPNSTSKESHCQHPLVEVFDIITAELGSDPCRGPFFNLNLFKINRLCEQIFKELEPVLRPQIELGIQQELVHEPREYPWLTGYVAQTAMYRGSGGKVDSVMLWKAATVVKRLAGDEKLDAYVLTKQAETAVLSDPLSP